jgi:hypothetical protein
MVSRPRDETIWNQTAATVESSMRMVAPTMTTATVVSEYSPTSAQQS